MSARKLLRTDTARKRGTHLDVVKVGRRLERVIVPVQVLAPAVQVGVVVPDRGDVALEGADVDPAWSIPCAVVNIDPGLQSPVQT